MIAMRLLCLLRSVLRISGGELKLVNASLQRETILKSHAVIFSNNSNESLAAYYNFGSCKPLCLKCCQNFFARELVM